MNLKTISSEVRYYGRSNGEVNIKNGHPIIKYPSKRNTLKSIKKNTYNDGYLWENTYPKIIKDIQTLDKFKGKKFENELKSFLKKYGSLLAIYKKQEVMIEDPDTPIIIKDKSIGLIAKYIRWFNYLTILVEKVIKNGEYDLYKKWLDKWVYNNTNPFRNGEGPYHIRAIQASEFRNDKKTEINIDKFLKNTKPYHPKYSNTGGLWDKVNDIDLLDRANKFNFILYTVYSKKEVKNNIKLKKDANYDDERYYYLALKSALKMFKRWIEESDLKLNINHLYDFKNIVKNMDFNKTDHFLYFKAEYLMEAIVLQYYINQLTNMKIKICANTNCYNPVPPGRSKYCSDKCQNQGRQNKHKENYGFNTSYYPPQIIKGKLSAKEVSKKENVTASSSEIKEYLFSKYNPRNEENKILLKQYKNKKRC